MKIGTVNTTGNKIERKNVNREKDPFNSQDKVEIGTNKTDDIGLVHKALRGLGKLAGGTVGAGAGAVIGGIKEPLTSITTYSLPNVAIYGALVGTVTGMVAGGILGGPAAVLPWTLAGGPIGAVTSLAFFRSGLLAGGYFAIKGAGEGGYEGAKIGARVGGAIVDKSFDIGHGIAGLFKGKEKPAEVALAAA